MRIVETLAVIGAGTMGSGIAQAACQAGYRAIVHDANPEALAAAVTRIHGFWDRGVAKGRVQAADRNQWVHHLDTASDAGTAMGDAAIVIEAVPESLHLKHMVFRAIDAHAPPGALLASNTSSLSIGQIAAATTRPSDVIGMHFFNPVPLMPLLELVRHPSTSDASVGKAEMVGRAMGKTTIVVKDFPGFATSRLGIVLGNEAARMVEDGVASVGDIDTAMRLGYGHPMGPLQLSDLVGLDVRHAISLHLHQTLGGTQWEPPEITKKLLAAGHLGKKSGQGFYDWTGEPKPRNLSFMAHSEAQAGDEQPDPKAERGAKGKRLGAEGFA